jgi:hypothetical protein
MPGFLKCNCEHCGGRIEYPAEAVGANVACPHCQQETPLKVESAGEDPEVVTVGGGKAKLVLGTVAACLVAVAALVAAGIWVKQRGTVKDSANAKPGPKTAGTPTPGAASATGGAKVELDPPKVVVPVVGKFQNGLSAAQIKSGRAIIAGPCTDCHRQYDPATYNGEEWSRIIGSMRGKAKLRGRESDDLDTFVRSVKN